MPAVLMKDLTGNRGNVGLFGPQLNGRLPPLVLSHDSDVIAFLPKDDQFKLDFRGCGLSYISMYSFNFCSFQNSVPHCASLTKPFPADNRRRKKKTLANGASRAPSCKIFLPIPPRSMDKP